MSNYPPGVTGNEPELTGNWPCVVCGGEGGNLEDGNCWMCGGCGIHPEEAPKCPECGSPDTDFFADLTSEVRQEHREIPDSEAYNFIQCNMCGEVSP